MQGSHRQVAASGISANRIPSCCVLQEFVHGCGAADLVRGRIDREHEGEDEDEEDRSVRVVAEQSRSKTADVDVEADRNRNCADPYQLWPWYCASQATD